MAKKSMKVKANKKQKFKVREYNRCPITGRARGFIRKFGMFVGSSLMFISSSSST